jgi:hypothetical protein
MAKTWSRGGVRSIAGTPLDASSRALGRGRRGYDHANERCEPVDPLIVRVVRVAPNSHEGNVSTHTKPNKRSQRPRC